MGRRLMLGSAILIGAWTGLLGCGGGGEPAGPPETEQLNPEAPRIVSVSPTHWPAAREMQFSAVVEGATPLSYSWSFGAAGIPAASNDSSPHVQLGRVGTYALSLTVTNSQGSDTYDWSFNATGYMVQGAVTTYQGRPLADVALFFNGGLGEARTDKDGRWWRDDIASGTFTVTPSRGDWEFAPDSLEFTVDNAEVSGLSFTFTGARRTTSDWVHSWTGAGAGWVVDVAVDRGGNVYVLSSTGVLLKYLPGGELLWARRWLMAESLNVDYTSFCEALAMDAQGQIYICGNAGYETYADDPFVARLSGTGEPVWQLDLSPEFDPADLQVSSAGEIYLAGAYEPEGADTRSPALVVFSSEGELLRECVWVEESFAYVNCLALSPANDACLVGTYYPEEPSGSSTFALCVDAENHAKWAVGLAALHYNQVSDVAADQAGNFYLAGNSKTEYGNENPRHASIFLKLSATGELLWQRAFRITDIYDSDELLCVAGPDNLYIGWELPSVLGSSASRYALLHLQSQDVPAMAPCLAHPYSVNAAAMELGPAGELIVAGFTEDASCYWDSALLDPTSVVVERTGFTASVGGIYVYAKASHALSGLLTGFEDTGDQSQNSDADYRTLLTVKSTP